MIPVLKSEKVGRIVTADLPSRFVFLILLESKPRSKSMGKIMDNFCISPYHA